MRKKGHTREPWSVAPHTNEGEYCIHGAGKVVAQTHSSENAHRIVSCINACAGMDEKTIRAFRWVADDHEVQLDRVAHLERQRDDLLSLLKREIISDRVNVLIKKIEANK